MSSWPFWLAALCGTLSTAALCIFAAHIPALRELTGAAPLDEDSH